MRNVAALLYHHPGADLVNPSVLGANFFRPTLWRLLVLLALIGVAGCAAWGPEPPFETTYSAVGAQVK